MVFILECLFSFATEPFVLRQLLINIMYCCEFIALIINTCNHGLGYPLPQAKQRSRHLRYSSTSLPKQQQSLPTWKIEASINSYHVLNVSSVNRTSAKSLCNHYGFHCKPMVAEDISSWGRTRDARRSTEGAQSPPPPPPPPILH